MGAKVAARHPAVHKSEGKLLLWVLEAALHPQT